MLLQVLSLEEEAVTCAFVCGHVADSLSLSLRPLALEPRDHSDASDASPAPQAATGTPCDAQL